ncbi:hypothetical protein [Microvirga sp. P5_D2]
MTAEVRSFYATARPHQVWVPRLFAVVPVGVVVMSCPDDDADDRETIYDDLRLKLRLLEADCYVLAAEAWMGNAGSALRPSQQPARREVMILSAADRRGATQGAAYELMRDWSTGGVKELAELPSGKELTGPIFELLREPRPAKPVGGKAL